jgi:hypothetical protein
VGSGSLVYSDLFVFILLILKQILFILQSRLSIAPFSVRKGHFLGAKGIKVQRQALDKVI